MLDRRKVIALGGVASVSALLPMQALLKRANGAGAVGHHAHGPFTAPVYTGPAPAVDPFTVRMPIPQVLLPVASSSTADLYELTIKPANVEILPGLTTAALTYGGQFVGPTIKAKTGRQTVVTVKNAITDPTTVHLHGGHTPANSDGYPMDPINPGQSRVYAYPNRQPAATMWYHDHIHQLDSQHVFKGLHGFYLLEDPAEESLGLPSGEYDVPVMLRDARFDENGALVYSPIDDFNQRTSILVNGKPQPYFPVAARKYRLRLLNAANHREWSLSLGGLPMIQIASDGGLLPAPVTRTELKLTPAERVEIVVDFSSQPIGSQVVLEDETGPVMRFDVDRTAPDNSHVPSVLRPLPASPPVNTIRDIKLGLSDTQDSFWINGKSFDPDRVDTTIKRGNTEIWRVYNLDSNISHNFHVHLVHFRVLDRDGAPPMPGESGLKDTVWIPPGTSVRIQATFSDYLGRYLYHCHMMEHAAEFGMMAQMEIVS